MKRVVLVGDSVCQCYQPYVAQELDGNAEVLGCRHDADILQFNAATKKVADELGVPVNDLYQVIDREGRRRLIMKEDGVHMTDEGNRILGRVVAGVIKDVLKGLKNGN